MKFIKMIVVKFNLINIFSIPLYLFRIFKIHNNRIFCVNFSGKGYGDNPKYIVEELLRSYGNDYEIFWAVSNINYSEFPKEVHQIKIYSFKYFYYLATSRIWINNSRFPLFVRKRKGQYYIQTWHGGLGLKKIEKDAIENLSEYYKKSAPHDSSMIDLVVSNSKYRTNIFQKSFWYDGKIAEFGCPRNDVFFSNNIKSELEIKIRERYGIPRNKKIILYAPTFRIKEFNYFSIDVDRLLDNLNESTGDEFVFLYRLHSRISNMPIKESERIINVSNYPDPDELLLITDILISDYSSIIFDFIYTGNPVYLYAPDYENYMLERGTNFVYDKLPFSISYTDKQLIDNIISKDYINYIDKLKNFEDEVGIVDDGTASKKVVYVIRKITEGGEFDGK